MGQVPTTFYHILRCPDHFLKEMNNGVSGPDCNLLSLDARQQRLMKFDPEAQNFSAPARFKVQAGTKRPASKTAGPPKKRHVPATSLSHQVAELSNAAQGIQALLAKSFPSTTSSVHEGMVTVGSAHSPPGPDPAAEGTRCALYSSL